MLTHSPAILPRSDPKHGFREKKELISAMRNSGSLLSVSGHCHWAHGLYHSAKGKIPCVVASVCDSKWLGMKSLLVGPSGKRGDELGDEKRGGYNLRFPIIVCDIAVPGGPPSPNDFWKVRGTPENLSSSLGSSGRSLCLNNDKEGKPRPRLLFFGPPTDLPAVSRLVPVLSERYEVAYFDNATEAVEDIRASQQNYDACVAKLGSTGNLGVEVVKALREKFGEETFVVIHSATAFKSERTKKKLKPLVDLIVDHSCEEQMLQVLFK